jgi:hypothetical protein
VGEVTIAHSSYGILRVCELGFMTVDARDKWAKALKDRAGNIDWHLHLETVCVTANREFRKPEPVLPASEIEAVPFRLAMTPFLPTDEIAMLVGERGTGKSLVADAIGVALIAGVELPGPMRPTDDALGPVGFIDYETGPHTFRRRVEAICRALEVDPVPIMPKFYYRKMYRPLMHEIDALLDMARRYGIVTWIIDSWRFPCGVGGYRGPVGCQHGWEVSRY